MAATRCEDCRGLGVIIGPYCQTATKCLACDGKGWLPTKVAPSSAKCVDYSNPHCTERAEPNGDG